MFGLGLIVLFGESRQQESLPYIFGYRSSYKFHPYGNIKLIISAPHDVPDRSSGDCGRKPDSDTFCCAWNYNDTCVDANPYDLGNIRDVLTDELAQNVANELDKTWSYKPFVMIGVWSRGKVESSNSRRNIVTT